MDNPLPPRALTLEPLNTFPAVAVAIGQAIEFLQRGGPSKHALFVAELSMEELLTNVVKYGHKDRSPHPITVRLDDNGIDCLSLIVEDDGHEFDPWIAPPPERAKPVLERSPGGQGLMLIKKFARSCDYQRIGSLNITKVQIDRSASE